MGVTAWLAVVVFVAAYALIATERVHRVAAALGGAVVMLLIGATDAEQALFSEETGIDWRVLVLLLGMMLIVAVLRRTGLFEFLAIWAVHRSRGRPFRLMVLLVLVTAGASALLDNVTTVLLTAPMTIRVCRQLGLAVAPYLIAQVLACNIGGTATLIGDPPNIMIGSRAGLSFNDFLVHLAPLVVVLLVVLIGLCRVMFASAFRVDPERVSAVMELRARDALKDTRLLVVSGVVVTLVVAGFVLHTVLHLEPSVVAIVGGLVLLAASRLDTGEVVQDVEWPTLAFFVGLFVMVGALVGTGVIGRLSEAAVDATGGHLFNTAMTLVFGSAVISGFVDNIPFVAAGAPVVEDLVDANGGPDEAGVLWWSFALGADLGGNATAIASSANVVVLGIADRHGEHISFWRFTRYGVVVTAVTVAFAGAYVWLRYFALGGA